MSTGVEGDNETGAVPLALGANDVKLVRVPLTKFLLTLRYSYQKYVCLETRVIEY